MRSAHPGLQLRQPQQANSRVRTAASYTSTASTRSVFQPHTTPRTSIGGAYLECEARAAGVNPHIHRITELLRALPVD